MGCSTVDTGGAAGKPIDTSQATSDTVALTDATGVSRTDPHDDSRAWQRNDRSRVRA